MTWRDVTQSDKVGTADDFHGRARGIFRCLLACGHYALVTVVETPQRCDCMVCDHKDGRHLQPLLPLFLPLHRERRL